MRVYLAGKMAGRPGNEVLKERSVAKRLMDYYELGYYDPAANEDIRADGTPVDLSMPFDVMRNFVLKDEFAIDNCDALLVLTGDTPSDGTLWECGRAYYHRRIPVILVAPKRASGEMMGFSNIKASAIFATKQEAIHYIATQLGGR